MITPHAADGTDEEGRCLDIRIRIGADGRLYFHDIPIDLLPVALAMNPHDATLRRRAEIAEHYEKEPHP